MSDSYQPMSREQFMEQYGVEPEAVMAQQAQAPAEHDYSKTPVTNHLRAAATGIASIPTDLYSLGPTLYAGGSALYRSYANDTKFLEEFRKDMQVDNAQENIQNHISGIVKQWQQRDPNLTQEDIDNGVANYLKSKDYEDFSMQQLRHFPYVAAKTKDTIRRFLGDERTDDERGWTESAAEVLGSAAVGGPAGAFMKGANKGAAMLGSTAVNAVNSLPARALIKTAEVMTPATIPYTGANVALNATAGVAIDQGVRYLQGKSTAFTPTAEDPNGVGALAATGVGVAGFAAFVAALKGRQLQALQHAAANPSATATALKNMPQLNDRVADPAHVGAAIVEGGPTPQYGPSSSMEQLSWPVKLKRKFETQFFDETAAGYRQNQDLHGTKVADDLELQQMSTSYTVMNDTLKADVSNATRDLHNAYNALSPEDQRAAASAWTFTSDTAQNVIRYDHNMNRLAELQATINHPQTLPMNKATAIAEHAQLQADLQRFTHDIRSARPRTPDIPMQSGMQLSDAWIKDMSPQMVKFKESVKNLNLHLLDLQVQAGKITREAADEMHRLNPYYVRAMNDPMKNKKGFARIWESATQGIARKFERQSEGSGAVALHEGPLRHLDKDIPPVQAAGTPETRITQPLHPLSAAGKYTEQAYRDVYLTRTRNEHVLHKAWQDGLGINKIPTAAQTDGTMRIKHAPGGKEWWTGSALHSQQARDTERLPGVVSVWQDGKMQLWEFGDHEFAAALRNEPVQLTGVMQAIGAATNTFKALTTGLFNIAWAPVGVMFNQVIGMLSVKPGRSFGTVGFNAQRFLPEWLSKHLQRFPDVSVPLTWPYQAAMAAAELLAYHTTQPIVRELTKIAPFAALQKAVGPAVFQKMVNAMLKTASWAENTPTAKLHLAGASTGHQSIDNVPFVRNAFAMMSEKIPWVAKAPWQFYKDLFNALYLADKRMYYTQNMALQRIRGKAGLPTVSEETIIREARVLAGDMAKVPASKTMRELERAFPYLTQTKLGTYHLMRHMGSKETAGFVVPRTVILTNMIAGSFYMMTYWDDKAREEFWQRTPEHERLKYAYVPTVKTIIAHAMGQKIPYSRDAVYKVPIPPDIAPIIAGMVAMWQMLGAIPADATPKPIAGDLFKILGDSVTPAMPPLAQVVLGASGLRLDPQSSETRGGDWIRNAIPRFKAGPQAEARTNLGEVSQSTALMTNAMLGAIGSHLVTGMDVFLHASKFNPGSGPPTPRESANFAAGLRAATSEVVHSMVSKVPDIPLLWQNQTRYMASTADWQYVKEKDQHIQAIKGMRNDAQGNASARGNQLAEAAGGIAPRALRDPMLIQLADEIVRWQNPTGDLGKLKKVYGELGKQQRSVSIQYNLSHDERRQRSNQIVRLMQDNMRQQHLATKYAEQMIAQKYGQYLAPRLGGRHLSLGTINAVMRESIGGASSGDPQE